MRGRPGHIVDRQQDAREHRSEPGGGGRDQLVDLGLGEDLLARRQRRFGLGANVGITLAVVSNWDDRLIPLMEKLGLATYFEHIIVSVAHGSMSTSATCGRTIAVRGRIS